MDIELFNDILKVVEPINQNIARGLAVKELKNVEKYMDKVWKSAAVSFPPNLYYESYRRCTPEEINSFLLRRYDSKTFYELSETDTFFVMYKFRYSDPYSGVDKNFHVVIRLPFVGKANTMRIMGTKYTIMSVAADPVFSASKTDYFLSLNKRNEKFYRFTYNFACRGIRHSASVVWSNMHGVEGGNRSKKKNVSVITANKNSRKRGIDRCPIALYLFCRLGLTESFKRFDAEVKVLEDESQAEKLEAQGWHICKSSKSVTSTVRGTKTKSKTITNDLILAVKKDVLDTQLKCLIASFFFITDGFAQKVKAQYVDEPRQWQVILGYTVFTEDKYKEGLMIQRIEQYLKSLDGYIDIISKESLEEIGVYVDNIYDLFIYIIKNIQSALLHSNPITMYNKKITVTPYLMSDIVAGINMFVFNLNKIKPNLLSYTTIVDVLKQNVKMDTIIQGIEKHREIVLVNSSCDVTIYEHTAKIILQSQITGKNSKNIQSSIEDKNIDVSVAEFGSYRTHTKKEPTGRSVMNLFVNISPNGMIIRNERLRPLLDETDSLL